MASARTRALQLGFKAAKTRQSSGEKEGREDWTDRRYREQEEKWRRRTPEFMWLRVGKF